MFNRINISKIINKTPFVIYSARYARIVVKSVVVILGFVILPILRVGVVIGVLKRVVKSIIKIYIKIY